MSKKERTKLSIIKALIYIGCLMAASICHLIITGIFALMGVTLGGIPTLIIVALLFGAAFKGAQSAYESVELKYALKHEKTAEPNVPEELRYKGPEQQKEETAPEIAKETSAEENAAESVSPAPQERAPEAPAAVVAPAAVTKTESKKKGKLQIAVIATLAILLCISVVFNISQTSANESLEADIQALQETIEKNKSNMAVLGNQNNQLKETMSELKEYKSDTEKEIEFFEENIGFINTDDAYYYHSYSCPLFNKHGKYWAYNNENTKYQGYVPCPYCH